MTQVIENIN